MGESNIGSEEAVVPLENPAEGARRIVSLLSDPERLLSLRSKITERHKEFVKQQADEPARTLIQSVTSCAKH